MAQKKSHEDIAVSIVKTLFDAGYLAYFAGGWVRDFLMGTRSNEIDIATSAPPEILVELFPKTINVGIAFGVVIVVKDCYQFEVTTFRKDHPYHDGRHPESVDYSTPQKDAERRDFTINGMFFDPLTKELHDYVEGQKDLKEGIIRAIGVPELRFEEDRLRMIRAVRFSSRFNFKIEEKTLVAIKRHAKTLFPAVSMERIWQEFNKMAMYPRFDLALIEMHELNLLQTIFPKLQGEIKRHVRYLPYFPLETPTIILLLELFPESTLEEGVDLCHYLKTSNADVKMVEFFKTWEEAFTKPIEKASLAKFYAHPTSSLFLEVQLAKKELHEKTPFQEGHEKAQEELAWAIERIKRHDPVLRAHHLEKEGIKPGVAMGRLLKEGERISINQNIQDVETLLKMLKASSLWP